MNCLESEMLIHAYLDGELDLLNTVQLEDHLRECAACAKASRNHQTLRSAINSGGFYFKAPNNLTERIHLALQEADRAGPHTSAPVQELPGQISAQQLPKRMRWQFSWTLAGIAAAAAMAALVVWQLDTAVSRALAGRPAGQGSPDQPRALAHGQPSDRRAVFRSAYGEAVV